MSEQMAMFSELSKARGFGHESTDMKRDEWLTPPHITQMLGPFDLDPCSPRNRPWDTAATHYNIIDDGLSKPWFGCVWMNPPYGAECGKWLARMAQHSNGIVLIFARTETSMFFEHVWGKADALLFLKGRLTFHFVDGSKAAASGGAPSVLIAYGQTCAQRLKDCAIPGAFIDLTAQKTQGLVA